MSRYPDVPEAERTATPAANHVTASGLVWWCCGANCPGSTDKPTKEEPHPEGHK